MLTKSLLFRWLPWLPAFVLIIGTLATGCKKAGTTTLPPSLATFLNLRSGNYFITGAGVTDTIPIGVTTVAARDRTITINVSSPTGAVSGTEYTLTTANISIPAGQTLGYIVVKGNYAFYNGTTRKDTLIFTFANSGEIAPSEFNDSFTLAMRGPCVDGYDFTAAEFDGIYNNCNDGGPPEYAVNIVSAPTGPTSATLHIQNLGAGSLFPTSTDPAVNPGIAVKIDWSDPSNLRATIDSQAYSIFPGFGPISIFTEGSPGTFSSCHQTFSLNYDFIGGGFDFGLTTTTIAR